MWKTWTGGPDAAPINSPQASFGGVAAPGGWHPTIIYLGILCLAEIFAVAFLLRLSAS